MGKTPKLRFEGFTEEWETRKLGELARFSKGTGYSKADLKENGTPIILYGRLYTDYKIVIDDVDTFTDAKTGSVYSHGGEVIVPASGETAEDISIASVVEKAGVLLGGDLNVITPPDNIDSTFLAISISNGKAHNDMAKMAQGKSVVHLHNTDLEKINLVFPSHNEQILISDFIKQIDKLITLHQRKSDGLRNAKSYYLQALLPQKGEYIPNIRFEGFSGVWKKHKLKDVAVSLDYGLNAAAKEFDGINKYLRITDIDDISHVFKDDNLTSPEADFSMADNYRLQDGDILFARTGASVGKTYIYRESDGVVYFAGFLIRAKTKSDFDAEFVYQNTLTSNYEKYIKITSQRSGQPGVNAQEYGEFSILFPDYAEQVRVGTFLRQIDRLIDLQQRKVDALKTMKKFMLQNMFV